MFDRAVLDSGHPIRLVSGLLLLIGIVVGAPTTTEAGGILDDVTRWPGGRSMSSSSARLGDDGRPSPTLNVDVQRIVEPGETIVIADLKGPGVITHIWMTMYHFQSLQFGPEVGGRANPREVLIRMYWDGREKPDVEVPLGDFFAAGLGKKMEVQSIPVVVEDGDSYNCWWRMPFRKSARIEVVNQGSKTLRAPFYTVDWIKKDS
ncbi:MAG TPA: hypothetical protein DD670_01510, partial [Planctomycetaceae bacterium]|nr:hypothetical protein [Planctomycetaceae bacterium]